MNKIKTMNNEQRIMSLRDYVAGQALVGLLAMDAHPASIGDAAIDCAGTASRAYGLSDAMLAESKKGGAE